tara:strand:+ start:3234 stop:3437 length:204 start_codon:yes stop_codon:yes gene_type:complete
MYLPQWHNKRRVKVKYKNRVSNKEKTMIEKARLSQLGSKLIILAEFLTVLGIFAFAMIGLIMFAPSY